ncbi:hypothetical protein, partial [Niallia circulans]|uniref:hypothetical protein n=1 Tax=Niallia circulans TaxID=1397 RepID=UPI001C52F00D
EEKVVFIKQMNTTMQEDRGKNGVHQGDESHNSGRPRKKWCSPANEHHNPRRPRKKWCSSSR